ncbi:MAG: hypothetical protein IJ728_13130 [Selenomonadaceae bacterium]|nr:hypothetical protein [Selenomonadaceae bacterium]
MNRKVLLIEPNYKNKYPPMGLMKISTYFRRECKDDVRFFKGDLKLFAARLLFEDFFEVIKKEQNQWIIYFEEFFNFIKLGRYSFLENIPNFCGTKYEELIKNYRQRYKDKDIRVFDIICITTLFTFYFKKTVETINQSKMFLKPNGKIFVGGVAATILPDKFKSATDIDPHIGILNDPKNFDKDDDIIIDELPLDYSILDEIDYEYPANDAYFGYMTRGCIRNCKFCAVPTLEPNYVNYVSIKSQLDEVNEIFGERKDLLLMDNNVFASSEFDRIIDEIKDCGFAKEATYQPPNEYEIAFRNLLNGVNDRAYIKKIIKIYNAIDKRLSEELAGQFYIKRKENFLLHEETATLEAIKNFDSIVRPLYEKLFKTSKRKRHIDFNQGVDARLVTDEKMKKLSEINIRPLRIAFDHYEQKEIYIKAIKLAAKYGIDDLSNYLLYNFLDKPEDLYYRMRLNVELCEELNVKIFSFPMRYAPIRDPDYFDNRHYVGKHWNKKFLRAVQIVLNSTKGKIGRGKSFFEEAFGKNLNDFFEILWMPEALIFYRHKYKNNLTIEWRKKFHSLNHKQFTLAKKIISENNFSDEVIKSCDITIDELLQYYKISH